MEDNEMKKIYMERYPDEADKSRAVYALQLVRWLLSKGILPMNRNAKILDLGSGTGLIYFALKKVGYLNVYASDRDKFLPEMIKGDIEKGIKQIKNETFDVIISRDVIEHVKDPDKFFKENYRMLKHGGRVIIMTPATEKLYLGEFYDGYDHHTPFSKIRLGEGLRLFGFKNIRTRYLRAIPVLWKYSLRAFDYVFSKRKCYVLGWAQK